MTKPIRLQLSRRKGFNLQAVSQATNGLPAVNVARPGPWGNPFIVGKDGDRAYCVELYKHMLNGYPSVVNRDGATIESLKAYRNHVLLSIDHLRRKNLACWCARDGKPCHADVLLDLANRPVCEEVQP